jgi:hypothetical protein
MPIKYATPADIANERHLARDCASTLTATANAITVTIAAVADKVHRLGSVVLVGTTGTGAAEALVIKDGATTVWEEPFTVGTALARQFQAIPLEATEGNALVVQASATNLTAGKLYVVYETKG